MSPDEIVSNVVKQTAIELKKFNDFELSGFYFMLNSEFTGMIKLKDDELILIQADNKVDYYESQDDFNNTYPSPKIEFFLPEPYKKLFSQF
ncbi:hypothetical protein JCM19297_2547 [Nonlabens ulvanivorans]|nr:hypothetical protein [Nonlabens ulvanivorans]GAK91102.1 hypothetical protein JCM19297_2547 [Nonlabens ulvanivorans]